MKTLPAFLGVALCCARGMSAAAGDDTISLGLSGGCVLPMHSGTFNFENVPDSFPRHTFGTGSGFRLGLSMVMPLDTSGAWSAGLNVGVSSMSDYKEELREVFPAIVDGKLIESGLYNTLKITLFSWYVEGEVRFKPFGNLGLGVMAGLGASYFAKTDYRQTNQLDIDCDRIIIGPKYPDIEPVVRDYQPNFTNDCFNELLLYEGETPDANRWQAYWRGGVFYEFLVGKRWVISPSVSYNFPLVAVSSTQTWRIHQLAASVDVRLRL